MIGLVGCGYHAGSFADWSGGFPGTRMTMGCIDLAVGQSYDVRAQGPIVSYGFGNRCHHAVPLDLATVRVRARDTSGVEHVMQAYDPRGEIRVLSLDALWAGHERIEYRGPDPRSLVSLCVDVGGVDPTVPRTEKWVCSDQHVVWESP